MLYNRALQCSGRTGGPKSAHYGAMFGRCFTSRHHIPTREHGEIAQPTALRSLDTVGLKDQTYWNHCLLMAMVGDLKLLRLISFSAVMTACMEFSERQ